ncbi:MAG: ABC transporter permease [Armatimonadetes bacterium]|nr:ABC transporter permease [Armatimonadota bacterium]
MASPKSPSFATVGRIARTREFGTLLSLVALCLLIVVSGSETRQHFLAAANLQNLLRHIALLSIFAIGETFVIITAGIDLSVGSLIAFVGVLSAHLMVRAHWGIAASVAVGLLFAAAVGAFHAALVGWVGLQPFVATLGTMSILRGAALLMTSAVPIAVPIEQFTDLGNAIWGGLPGPAWFLIAVTAIAVFVLHFSVYGKYIYAVGSNEQAARLSGINVQAVKLLAYTFCALLTGLAGILYAAYTRQGDPASAFGYELNAIASAVIGGCNLMGGEGSIVGTILGASILSVILNGLNLMIKRNASLWEGVMVGTVVLAAVALNTWRRRRS